MLTQGRVRSAVESWEAAQDRFADIHDSLAFALDVLSASREVPREVPRDRVCYYCQTDQHERCADLQQTLKLCACYPCRHEETDHRDEGGET
jgi:hypothetical protein